MSLFKADFDTNPSSPTITFLGRTFQIYDILRLIIIVGAYLLFRPYLLKFSQSFQERDHNRPINTQGGEADSPAAVGGDKSSKLKGIEAELDEESDGEDMSWGAKARRRKREEMKARRKLMEEEERRRKEEESDEDIAEFLEKEEGK